MSIMPLRLGVSVIGVALLAVLPPAILRAQCNVPSGVPPLRQSLMSLIGRSTVATGGSHAETEPNNDATTGLLVALGDSANGTIGAPGDEDFYALDLAAGTRIDVKTHDATPPGAIAPWHSTLTLIDRDGHTVITKSVYDYIVRDDRDARLRWTIEAAGRYYVVISDYEPYDGGSEYRYGLSLREYRPPTPGPGDPTTEFARLPGEVSDIVAGPHGDVYTTGGDRIYHVSASGQVTTFVTGVAADFLGIDRHANIYVAGCQYPNGVIWRVTPSGDKSVFYASDIFTPMSIAAGPDGDIWVSNAQLGGSPEIMRLSPTGELKDGFHTPSENYAEDLVFSPSGDLYFNSFGGTFKLVGGVPQNVSSNFVMNGVFDRDGYMYGTRMYGYNPPSITRMTLLDPTFTDVKDSFAIVNDYFEISELHRMTFLRDANGRMTKRLLIGQTLTPSQLNDGPTYTIQELNPAGIRAAGFGFDFAPSDSSAPASVTVDEVTGALLGKSTLSTAALAYVDSLGNKNGRLDVGDLRALLKTEGRLSTSQAKRKP